MFRLATCSALLLLAPLLPAAAQTSAAETTADTSRHSVDVHGMDRSAKPGDAFYEYANGAWLKQTEIPADRSTYSAGAMLSEIVDRRVSELIQEAAKSTAPAGSERRKIGEFYTSFMDTTAIEAAGLEPLRPTLDSIAAIHDRAGLAHFLGSTLRADVDALNATNFYTENLFGLWVAQDLDDPTQYSPFLFQGGLGMPERSYYLDSSATMAAIRGKYREHIAAMLGLAGVPDTGAKASAIAALETRIAQVHWTRQASGDVEKGNNHWARADFASKAPGLDWDRYFAAAGLDRAQRFVVWQPSAVTGIAELTAKEPLDAWKAYLTYHAIQSRSAVLPGQFDREAFAFYGPALTGAKQQRDRWKRAVAATNEALGFAVGRLYVARYFPPAEKARAQAMVRNLIAAFRARLDRLDWMAATTRRQAKAKLAVLKVGVGYPDTWPAYDDLEVRPGDAYGNLERARLRQLRLSLARLGRPVDRGEWVMTPQTVNAVNLPAMNALNFPAAILQPPYIDAQRPLAMDYGAIGAVIGHEVSHSFDNQGALFDARGRLRNWWTPQDFKHFKTSSQQLVAQYDSYRPFPDLAVKGQQTLGENIADLAGLTASYDAFHRALRGKPAPEADGFTGDEQFFISYAQSWRGKSRDLALGNRILTDGHAPSQYRALTVRTIDPWYRAFAVKPGDKLYLAPADRVRVW
jgi:predicted metalloendopeptidase